MKMTDKKFEELTEDEFKNLKIEFAPGCFDNFEGTQEELDGLIAEIQRMFASGEVREHSHQLTDEDFDELPDDIKEQLMRDLESNEGRTLQ